MVRSAAVMLERVKPRFSRTLKEDARFVDTKIIKEIESLAADLKGLRVLVVSATPFGGGVAGILHSMVPLMRSVGVKADWFTTKVHDQAFFDATKHIHNQLQGYDATLSRRERSIYLRVNKELAKRLIELKDEYDIIYVHDPQPAAAYAIAKKQVKDMPKAIWRCHIDTSHPKPSTWQFLRPFIRAYDQAIFTLPEYVPPAFTPKNVHFFPPTIDPLDTRLLPMKRADAQRILNKFDINVSKPIVTQISRFDIWKDPHGVVDAYRVAKREIPDLVLVLTGPLAYDDPEAVDVFDRLVKYIEGMSSHEHIRLNRDVFILSNQDGFSFKELNALYTASDVIVQKSLVEGFGLVVTEANFKGRPVIGSNTGGIRQQIVDARQDSRRGTGILVDIEAPDRGIQETGKWIVEILKDQKRAKKLGKNAAERVGKNYLDPHGLRNILRLFKEMGVRYED